jgi:type IV pilus modification protein PilV
MSLARSSIATTRTASLGAERGISMVEVLIAVLVFTVGALGLAAVVPIGLNKVTDSAADTRASELASDRCEQLLATPYADETLDAGAHEDDANPHDGLYDVAWNVEEDQPRAGCKRITVTVNRTGTSRTLVRLMVVNSDAGG